MGRAKPAQRVVHGRKYKGSDAGSAVLPDVRYANNALPKHEHGIGNAITKVDTQGGCMSDVSLTVNGKRVSGSAEDRTLLVHFLRENLGLTGTHVGCDTSQCGACVVHVDGRAVKSCSMLAVQAAGSTVVTIEGLANGADLHPVQAAFKEHHGLQCGFCTPGMIMAATDMIARHPEGLDEATVRAELEGNICRCTGYHNIVKAILAASQTMSKGAKGRAKQAA
jgi:carbon-monoxide dehydrogenase small subunit